MYLNSSCDLGTGRCVEALFQTPSKIIHFYESQSVLARIEEFNLLPDNLVVEARPIKLLTLESCLSYILVKTVWLSY